MSFVDDQIKRLKDVAKQLDTPKLEVAEIKELPIESSPEETLYNIYKVILPGPQYKFLISGIPESFIEKELDFFNRKKREYVKDDVRYVEFYEKVPMHLDKEVGPFTNFTKPILDKITGLVTWVKHL